jgi:hypothetical protein
MRTVLLRRARVEVDDSRDCWPETGSPDWCQVMLKCTAMTLACYGMARVAHAFPNRFNSQSFVERMRLLVQKQFLLVFWLRSSERLNRRPKHSISWSI